MRLPTAGELDRLVEVQYKSTTLDPVHGTPVDAWLPLVLSADSPPVAVHLPAQIQDALPSRSESVTQGLATARNQTRIRLRWRDDIDSSMRVVDVETDVIYQIIGGPAMLGRREFLEIQCERYSTD